jgi:hypothetical protein
MINFVAQYIDEANHTLDLRSDLKDVTEAKKRMEQRSMSRWEGQGEGGERRGSTIVSCSTSLTPQIKYLHWLLMLWN